MYGLRWLGEAWRGTIDFVGGGGGIATTIGVAAASFLVGLGADVLPGVLLFIGWSVLVFVWQLLLAPARLAMADADVLARVVAERDEAQGRLSGAVDPAAAARELTELIDLGRGVVRAMPTLLETPQEIWDVWEAQAETWFTHVLDRLDVIWPGSVLGFRDQIREPIAENLRPVKGDDVWYVIGLGKRTKTHLESGLYVLEMALASVNERYF